MRIIFMGTPEFSVPALEQLHAAGHDICAVYTRPPAKKGRGMTEQTSPVHQAALALGVPVLTPTSFKSTAEIEQLAAFQADLCVVVAYGLILPQAVLDIPQYGCWNIHASLLPRWRGRRPFNARLWRGTHKPAFASCKWRRGWIQGLFYCKTACQFTLWTPRKTCMTSSCLWARRKL